MIILVCTCLCDTEPEQHTQLTEMIALQYSEIKMNMYDDRLLFSVILKDTTKLVI